VATLSSVEGSFLVIVIFKSRVPAYGIYISRRLHYNTQGNSGCRWSPGGAARAVRCLALRYSQFTPPDRRRRDAIQPSSCVVSGDVNWLLQGRIQCKRDFKSVRTIDFNFLRITEGNYCLARSANLPEGLYILPSVSFIFLYIIFFNDFLETNYLKIRRTDFRKLYIE